MAAKNPPQIAQQRKEHLMKQIRVGAAAAACALAVLLAGAAANAQEVTGRVVGQVVDKDSGQALGGVTVIVQGPQGEDATITDEKGDYGFTSLQVGRYVIRFYLGNAATQVEQPDVMVQAEKTVRVNARISGAAQAAAAETTVIKARAPIVDIGSARVGATFDDELNRNLPVPLTMGELIEKAPGAFIDPSGNVSIGGATGLENTFMVNGLNVTGMEFGNTNMAGSTLSGGTNLPLEFLSQVDVNSGGYQAEFGGGMGGVINSVLKTGGNEFHGSVFGYDAPYWLSAAPQGIRPTYGNVLGGVRKPDFDSQIGFEVSGPLIKDKLFFWVGFAPRIADTHVFRELFPLTAAAGTIGPELQQYRKRLDETHRTYNYAASLDFVPAANHHVNLSIIGTPSFNKQVRSFQNQELISDPSWAMEQQNQVNTDVIAHWTSKLFDRHWQIDASAGLHSEVYSNKSPNDDLNTRNQLEYWGSNLYDLEGINECAPVTMQTATGPSTYQPCPVNQYRRGGFGQVKEFNAQRWLGEIKSTHTFYLAGHAEVKYGWRMEYTNFNQDRYYSGLAGQRALVQLAPNGGNPLGLPPDHPYFNTYSFFTLPANQFPAQFGGPDKPFTDYLNNPYYQDHLRAVVASLSDAFFVQASHTPSALQNLTVNLGLRYEMQRMSDYHGVEFMSTDNLAPRVNVIYDPFNDGRSKISASYGKYYETIPMSMASRFFGGEGILVRNAVPLPNCPGNLTNAYNWTGNGEWRACGVPPLGGKDDPQVVSNPPNSGTNDPVQSHIKGQYHQEIVATLERELMDDLSVRLDYQHRWLGDIIEDGTSDPSGSFAFVLANPGDVPAQSLTDAANDVKRLQTLDQSNPVNAGGLAAAQAKLANLQGLAKAPKPERTYDALTLTVNKRFSQNWRARGSYTYSRLVGNYEGLYQVEGDNFAPNVSNAYDTPDLYLNQRGRLPNDHPHQARLDGYYSLPLGDHNITVGLGFVARSGMPRNYISSWYVASPENMLLPRGSAGRTPTVTRFDLRFSYGLKMSKTTRLDAFIDMFNLFNQRTTVQTDDIYTNDLAPAIVNGTVSDLKFAKNISGQPLIKNPNFGQAVKTQAPFSTRLGLRLSF